jgi:beta-glucosidase
MQSIQSQVDELITQMRPAEKAGQLTQYFYFRLPADAEPAPHGSNVTCV